MEKAIIIGKINNYMHSITIKLSEWLLARLPHICEDWWQQCVLDMLSYYQRTYVVEQAITSLNRLDLAALLRIADKNWYEMRNIVYLAQDGREHIRGMATVRNNWAHCSGMIPSKDAIIQDVDIILRLAQYIDVSKDVVDDIEQLLLDLNKASFGPEIDKETKQFKENQVSKTNVYEIKEKDMVWLKSNPEMRGIVMQVTQVGHDKKYDVFIDNQIRSYYREQIELVDTAPKHHIVDVSMLQSSLTAYQLRNPSSQSLYSLNSARIDFVPYQFRPALKMIRSDTPRILIADSVGVGKTIEAGLILKEIQARSSIESIIIICPKPLIAERKWQMEMRKFDEEFSHLDGPALTQVISDADRDGVWPDRANKAIIPYSILQNDKVLLGSRAPNKGKAKRTSLGLLDLDPEPHFDMVIVDEAHHIRNSNTNSYASVKYFCDHADAVVFLTATPLQTSDDDLYTLLNVLRPDVILDRDTFMMMGRPNPHINKAIHLIRAVSDNWQVEAIEALKNAGLTQWGQSIIIGNPVYKRAMSILTQNEITRDERVQLITDVESLHSFFGMINRTRRQDIQDFCVRRSYTKESSLTPKQRELHDELLLFEATALSLLHDNVNVNFMMCTIMRQAASCIFGLAPFLNTIVNRRLSQIWDDPEHDIADYELKDADYSVISGLANKLIELGENLPDDDPKYDDLLRIIQEKQQFNNNKIILFSTFKHTLAYLRKRLQNSGLRIAQIDGSVKDDDRYTLRGRFKLDKNEPSAIDILLFTEVGSEGLDYQFCDLMINYDLPWNPMRIEQRIGRIDRRGQKSEAVSIYNMITANTIDATIYYRCLSRIGVFEESIGECSEILGQLHTEIESIMLSPLLSEDEKALKLEQMADNEVRQIQEIRRLESEEKQLFGFDLSNYMITKEVQEAENFWISPSSVQSTVQKYFQVRLGDGNYIIGESPLKSLRLSMDAKRVLLDDYRELALPKSVMNKAWERYLKQQAPICQISFESECAYQNPDAMFITNQHPLAKQAAESFDLSRVFYVGITIHDTSIKPGEYPFAIYAWDYLGYKAQRKLVPICSDPAIQLELLNLIESASGCDIDCTRFEAQWTELETLHRKQWLQALEAHRSEANDSCKYKKESLSHNFLGRKRILLGQIGEAKDERIRRMRTAELENVESRYQRKTSELDNELDKADIHAKLLVSGVLAIHGG